MINWGPGSRRGDIPRLPIWARLSMSNWIPDVRPQIFAAVSKIGARVGVSGVASGASEFAPPNLASTCLALYFPVLSFFNLMRREFASAEFLFF